MRSRHDLIPVRAGADGLVSAIDALEDSACRRRVVEAATAVLHTLTADCVEPDSAAAPCSHSSDASVQPWEGSAMWF